MVIKTTIHKYRFNISKEEDKRSYKELCKRLKRSRKKLVFLDYSPPSDLEDGAILELETEFLFDNQWNTKGLRVFDWAEGLFPNKNIKEGCYLEINDEMIHIRNTTLKCQYCGKQKTCEESGFCDSCLGSPLLKKKDLHLLRMLPISHTKPQKDLSKKELAFILPKYTHCQTQRKKS